ncbi:hypothetical protein FPQ18DRAFT_391980 [Pyronema domesticum]|nr:hypothetical protein FPQ18DRAFT_391980 [Pyronema domesticum]
MSFGFSVGDFLAAATLATQLYTFFFEVRGSEAVYNEAVSLFPLYLSRHCPQHFILLCYSFRVTAAGYYGREWIGVSYEGFDDSRKYTESLILNPPSNTTNSFWKSKQKAVVKDIRKMQWCLFDLFDAKATEAPTRKLQQHIIMFDLFIGAAN